MGNHEAYNHAIAQMVTWGNIDPEEILKRASELDISARSVSMLNALNKNHVAPYHVPVTTHHGEYFVPYTAQEYAELARSTIKAIDNTDPKVVAADTGTTPFFAARAMKSYRDVVVRGLKIVRGKKRYLMTFKHRGTVYSPGFFARTEARVSAFTRVRRWFNLGAVSLHRGVSTHRATHVIFETLPSNVFPHYAIPEMAYSVRRVVVRYNNRNVFIWDLAGDRHWKTTASRSSQVAEEAMNGEGNAIKGLPHVEMHDGVLIYLQGSPTVAVAREIYNKGIVPSITPRFAAYRAMSRVRDIMSQSPTGVNWLGKVLYAVDDPLVFQCVSDRVGNVEYVAERLGVPLSHIMVGSRSKRDGLALINDKVYAVSETEGPRWVYSQVRRDKIIGYGSMFAITGKPYAGLREVV